MRKRLKVRTHPHGEWCKNTYTILTEMEKDMKKDLETLGEMVDFILVAMNVLVPVMLIAGSIFYELVVKTL